MDRYATMCIQFSRGCPYNCDFCNVTALLGHRVRTKTSAQILAELNGLYDLGWRAGIFFVDDNFIGNRKFLKEDLLPALIDWGLRHPGIRFNTEASINLADDSDLMALMVKAGFREVFIGIETPNEESLAECGKRQNRNRDLVEDVRRIQRAGLQVQGGFIVGFDHDTPSVFKRQIEFIQKSGIVTAMVGLLQAPAGTRLHERMRREGRLAGSVSGDNADGSTNIVTRMNLGKLKEGYREILNHIYSPRHYYRRIRTFLEHYEPPKNPVRLSRTDLMAFFRSTFQIGILGRERFHYWKLVFWTWWRKPRAFPQSIRLMIYGHHFRKVSRRHVR
jgi:radical SAM superfamily enzyme YgiQ (UPF0313 family)